MKIELVSWLSEMIDHFWSNKTEMLKEDFVFDYPNYGGLPKRISIRLYSDLVDNLQYELKPCLYHSKTKKEFAVQLLDILGHGLIRVK